MLQICELKEEAKQARLQVEQQALDVQEVQKTLAVQKRSADEFRQKHEQQLDVAESRVKSLEERLASLIAEKQRLERREATLTTQVSHGYTKRISWIWQLKRVKKCKRSQWNRD